MACRLTLHLFVSAVWNYNHYRVRNFGDVVVRGCGLESGTIFDLETLFFPINESNQHWTFVVVNMCEHKVRYYDSLYRNTGERQMNIILDYLSDEHTHQYSSRRMDPAKEDWRAVRSQLYDPKQTNVDDCGAFACTTARFIAMGLPLYFGCQNMRAIRLRIAIDLLDLGVAPPSSPTPSSDGDVLEVSEGAPPARQLIAPRPASTVIEIHDSPVREGTPVEDVMVDVIEIGDSPVQGGTLPPVENVVVL